MDEDRIALLKECSEIVCEMFDLAVARGNRFDGIEPEDSDCLNLLAPFEKTQLFNAVKRIREATRG